MNTKIAYLHAATSPADAKEPTVETVEAASDPTPADTVVYDLAEIIQFLRKISAPHDGT